MARPLRIQYPGAVYHVTCRGNERKEIYLDKKDRSKFLQILFQTIEIYHIKLYTYVLMNNHFHLLVETPLGNLGEFMRRFNITYTGDYNRRHQRVGHLYQGRYKSCLVDKDAYLSKVSRYIHLNPVRTNFFTRKSDQEKMDYLLNYRWSSLPGYVFQRKREDAIDYELVLSEYGGDHSRGRQVYTKIIYQDIKQKLEIKDDIIGQSILGGEEFVQWIRKKVGKGKADREMPSLKKIRRYKSTDEILKAIEKVAGMGIDELKSERGSTRQVAMDLLYKVGGLKGVEIGDLLGVDYSTVSVGRKRLREKLRSDKKLKALVRNIEMELSIIKI